MSAGRKVLAIGTAILACSIGGMAAASVLSRAFSEPIGEAAWVAVILAIGAGIALGVTLWFVVVRRLNLYSWDEIYEYFDIDQE